MYTSLCVCPVLAGTCIGPAFPGFQYDSNRGAHAASISWKLTTAPRTKSNINLHCFFDGGGYFLPRRPTTTPQGPSSSDTLAVYTELPGSPTAVVKCKVGQGVAVLSGVHWEYKGSQLDDMDPYLKDIVPLLETSEPQRQLCVQSTMKHLGLSHKDLSKL